MTRSCDASALEGRIDEELRALGRPERAEAEKSYLKSDLAHFGVTVPAIRSVVKAIARNHPDMSRPALLSLVEELWSKPVHERRMAAVELLVIYRERLRAADARLLERLLRDSKTWALVDPLAATVMGNLVERHVSLGRTLDRWSRDDDFWMRRSALLALMGPLRQGAGDWERFSRYADAMLEGKEFFVRKAIGWVLREVGKNRPDLVYDWIASRTHRASGVTMREAVKPMDHAKRERLMAAYREKRPAD